MQKAKKKKKANNFNNFVFTKINLILIPNANSHIV